MLTMSDTREPIAFRRALRRNATDAEQRLWHILRNRRLGAKFRRQHPVGPYVLDFYCPRHHLAVELDGGQHFEEEEIDRDLRRDAFLAGRGIRVIRFTNLEVFQETNAALEVIWEAIRGDATSASYAGDT